MSLYSCISRLFPFSLCNVNSAASASCAVSNPGLYHSNSLVYDLQRCHTSPRGMCGSHHVLEVVVSYLARCTAIVTYRKLVFTVHAASLSVNVNQLKGQTNLLSSIRVFSFCLLRSGKVTKNACDKEKKEETGKRAREREAQGGRGRGRERERERGRGREGGGEREREGGEGAGAGERQRERREITN